MYSEAGSGESKRKESTSVLGYSHLFYEPGVHEMLGAGWDRKLERLWSGDFKSTMWNPEVTKRISSYGPTVVFVDSQPAFNPLGLPDHRTEVYAWFGLPGRVGEINKEGVLYLVQGDIAGPGYYEMGQDTQESLRIEKVAARSDEIITSINTRPFEMTLVGLLAASIWLSKKVLSSKEITRREFLKTLGAGALFGFISGINAIFLDLAFELGSGAARTTEERDRWLDIANLLRPRILDTQIVHGRTAMGIDKTIDALSFLGLPDTTPGSILFGAAHNSRANDLVTSDKERRKAVSAMAKTLLRLQQEIIGEKKLQIDTSVAGNNLLDLLALVRVLEIRDPKDLEPGRDAVSAIVANTTTKGFFKSRRIEQATSSLRSNT